MKKTERQKLVARLDKLVRERVLARDKYRCCKCEKPVSGCNAHVAHIISRRNYKLRWDMRNLRLLCYYDHIRWAHNSPLEFAEWFKGRYPQDYKYLMKHKNDIASYSVADLYEIEENLQRS